MYKPSKKRSGRKKLSSSSSDEDEKEDKNRTRRKRKTEPSNEKNDVSVQKKEVHTICSKDGSQSSRHVKKPVYRLEKPKTVPKSSSRDEKKSSDLMIPRTVSFGKKGQPALKTMARCDIPPTQVQRYSPSSKEELCKKRRELVKEIQQRRTPDKELREKKEAKIPPATTSKQSSMIKKTSSSRTPKASSGRQRKEPLPPTTPSRTPSRTPSCCSDFRTSKRAFSADQSTKDNKKGSTNSVPKQKPHSSPMASKSKTSQKREIGPSFDIFSTVCQSETSNSNIPKKDTTADTSAKKIRTAPTNSEHKSSALDPLPSNLKQTTVQPKQDLGPSFLNTFSPVLNTELSNFKIPKKTIVADETLKDKKTAPTNSGNKPSNSEASPLNFKLKTVQQTQDFRPPFANTFSAVCNTEPTKFRIPKNAFAAGSPAKDKTVPTNSGPKQNIVQPNKDQQPSFVDTFSTESSNFKTPQKANTTAKHVNTFEKNNGSKPSNLEALSSNFPIQQSPSSITFSSSLDIQKQDPQPSFVNTTSAVCYTDQSPCVGQAEVVEELHLARSERRLELNVMQSYGELTSMEIDPSEEGPGDPQSKKLPQQELILVLDTNILLSHLEYVKRIVSRGLGAGVGYLVLIPWVVLQELDSLKNRRDQTGSVADKAIPAISYIYNSLKSKESHLWGQSMQQAAESANGLNAQNNDDRVLQCCLQYQRLYPEGAVVLCTDDKNLCCKALLSGVPAFCKTDLEKQVSRSRHGVPFLQSINISPPHNNRWISSTLSCAATETQDRETGPCADREDSQLRKVDEAKRRSWDLSSLLCEFECCLQGTLSDVLEAEMKAGFADIWLEIVYIKPPWSLNDVLQCFKKHWYAVFGLLVPRSLLQNVLNLIEFFKSDNTTDCNSTLRAVREAKDLLKELVKSSSRVPCAITALDNILNKLQTQGETVVCDVVMKEDEEDKQTTSPQVSHSNVWAVFENIWEKLFQTSLEVFKALDFDPNAPPSVRPVGGPPLPQDALACLDQLLCMASQLLQAFSSVLLSAPGLAEVQSLLSIIQSSKIVNVDKLTAADLLDCFSQQEYRNCLNNGGKQLMELKAVLERCVHFTGQSVRSQL